MELSALEYNEPFRARFQSSEEGEPDSCFLFWCPGCGHLHSFNLKPQANNPNYPVWQWNGNKEKPTFTPSLLNTHPNGRQVCHLFLTIGKIEYLSDCTHEYAGKTVEVEMKLEP